MIRQQGGFTLMETIVALVLFSSIFVALYKGLEKGGASIRQSRMEAAASTLALSLLASAGIEKSLENAQFLTGAEDRFSWTMNIRQASGLDALAAAPSKAATFWVDVEVSWRDGPRQELRTASYRTLKLGLRS